MEQLTLDGPKPEELHPIFGDLKPEVVTAFFVFHRENPKVFELFRKYSEEARKSGHERYGAEAIIQRIRWHTSIETSDVHDFKINNNHHPCYSRLLMLRDPSFVGFFSIRHSPGSVPGVCHAP